MDVVFDGVCRVGVYVLFLYTKKDLEKKIPQ